MCAERGYIAPICNRIYSSSRYSVGPPHLCRRIRTSGRHRPLLPSATATRPEQRIECRTLLKSYALLPKSSPQQSGAPGNRRAASRRASASSGDGFFANLPIRIPTRAHTEPGAISCALQNGPAVAHRVWFAGEAEGAAHPPLDCGVRRLQLLSGWTHAKADARESAAPPLAYLVAAPARKAQPAPSAKAM